MPEKESKLILPTGYDDDGAPKGGSTVEFDGGIVVHGLSHGGGNLNVVAKVTNAEGGDKHLPPQARATRRRLGGVSATEAFLRGERLHPACQKNSAVKS